MGMAHCKACGTGTQINEERTLCEHNCHFSATFKRPDGSSSVADYNLGALSSSDTMYGPVFKRENDTMGLHEYFLNVCTKDQTNATCLDSKGKPLYAYACQIPEGKSAAKSLGDTINFERLPDTPGDGVLVRYTGGTPGCLSRAAPDDDTLVPRAREAAIHFVCDVLAGRGSPTHRPHVETIETAPCYYEFEWRSIFACRLCTMDDYDYVETDCLRGQAERQYFWKEPRHCYQGVALPATTTFACENVKVGFLAVAMVLGGLLLALVAVVILFFRNRRIHSEYAILKSTHGSDAEVSGLMDAGPSRRQKFSLGGDVDEEDEEDGFRNAAD